MVGVVVYSAQVMAAVGMFLDHVICVHVVIVVVVDWFVVAVVGFWCLQRSGDGSSWHVSRPCYMRARFN